jgi:hypothetical protein
MEEFPDIRGKSLRLLQAKQALIIAVDFFRRDPELRAPLACFLSHVHSDHLAGLETLKAPLYESCRISFEVHLMIMCVASIALQLRGRYSYGWSGTHIG